MGYTKSPVIASRPYFGPAKSRADAHRPHYGGPTSRSKSGTDVHRPHFGKVTAGSGLPHYTESMTAASMVAARRGRRPRYSRIAVEGLGALVLDARRPDWASVPAQNGVNAAGIALASYPGSHWSWWIDANGNGSWWPLTAGRYSRGYALMVGPGKLARSMYWLPVGQPMFSPAVKPVVTTPRQMPGRLPGIGGNYF